ncbi:MAG: polysaccharide pyruvyl transferase family protein [bacterium]
MNGRIIKQCNPPHIYIGGNIYGAGNIGDDAVLQGILTLINSFLPEAVITIGTAFGQKLSYLPDTVTYIDSYNQHHIINAVKKCDVCISGGGTMISDELNGYFPLEYNAQLISIAKFFGKRVVMLAVGANKLKLSSSKKIGRMIIALCDLITLRDDESRDECLLLGADPFKTYSTADPAFLLEAKETARTKQLKHYLKSRGRIFGINIVNECWAHLEDYKQAIAGACDFIAKHYGYVPVFFCNEVRPGNFFDYEANKLTASFLKSSCEILDPIYYSPQEMIDILSTFEFIIGMRMHSLIFAAIANTPFVTISRIDKINNFMKIFGYQASGSINTCKDEDIISDIEHILKQRAVICNQISQRVILLRQKCWKNKKLFRHLLSDQRLLWYKIHPVSLKFLLSSSKSWGRLQHLLSGKVTTTHIINKLAKSFKGKGMC